jgi:hypothetical protein
MNTGHISITLFVSIHGDIQNHHCNSSLSIPLGNELNNTTGLLDLALGLLADIAGLDDKRNVRETALSEDLGVAQCEEVEDDGLVGGSVLAQVLLASLLGDKSPKLFKIGSATFPTQMSIFSVHDDRDRCWIEKFTLSRLMVGFQKWLRWRWKYLIPTLPK